MSDLTPLNQFPFPTEFEEPYYPTIKAYALANDQATWALSENDNLIWSGGNTFSWSATTGNLLWGAPVEIRAKTTPYKVIIQGPPLPGGQVHLNDGECAFFQLPRLLIGDQLVPSPLTVGPISLLPVSDSTTSSCLPAASAQPFISRTASRSRITSLASSSVVASVLPSHRMSTSQHWSLSRSSRVRRHST